MWSKQHSDTLIKNVEKYDTLKQAFWHTTDEIGKSFRSVQNYYYKNLKTKKVYFIWTKKEEARLMEYLKERGFSRGFTDFANETGRTFHSVKSRWYEHLKKDHPELTEDIKGEGDTNHKTHISLKEYARRNGLGYSLTYSWYANGKLKQAEKVRGRIMVKVA